MEKRKSNRRFYNLNIEPLKNQKKNYRLGLMQFDFHDLQPLINQITNVEVKLNENNTFINIESALGTYLNYGKLVSPHISDWITNNNLHNTQKGQPAKIIFELKILKLKHIYILYKNQLNLICNSK